MANIIEPRRGSEQGRCFISVDLNSMDRFDKDTKCAKVNVAPDGVITLTDVAYLPTSAAVYLSKDRTTMAIRFNDTQGYTCRRPGRSASTVKLTARAVAKELLTAGIQLPCTVEADWDAEIKCLICKLTNND